MDARARRRQRTHARASLVHRAYFFINASARARRSPADAISSVRPSVRSFVRSRLPSSRSSPIASAPPRVEITSHDRRARASGTRARARRDDKRRPTDRPTTDDRPTRGKCQMSEYTYLYCTLKTTKYPYRIHTSHMGIYTLHYGPRTHRARTRALEPKGFDKPLDRMSRSSTHTHARDGVHVFRAIRDSLPRRRSSTRAETSRSRLVRRDARRGGDRGERDRAGLDRGANDLRVHRA